MHSRMQSRRAARYQAANVAIGDDFQPERVDCAGTERRLSGFLGRCGELSPLRKCSRVMRLWEKVRSGQIQGETAGKIRRDHAAEFERFDAEAAWLARRATGAGAGQ